MFYRNPILLLWLLLTLSGVFTNPLNLRNGKNSVFRLEDHVELPQVNSNSQDIKIFVEYFNAAVNNFSLGKDLFPQPEDENQIDIVCNACKGFYKWLNNLPRGWLLNIVKPIAFFICNQFEDATVCQGVREDFVKLYFDGIIKRLIDPRKVCPLLRFCDPDFTWWSFDQYVNETLAGKPNTTAPTPTGRSTYKVLHISDPHVDLEYKEGSNPNCGEPLCCRSGTGPAGFWGHPGACDLPIHTFAAVLDYIRDNLLEDIEMILWTGDNIGHNIWSQDTKTQAVPSKMIANMIAKKLGTNITLVATTGNHEAFPVNFYDYYSDRDQWLNTDFADLLKPFINSTDVYDQLKTKGYYVVYDTAHKLRIIGYNSQACNEQNAFLFTNPSDPGGQLEWLYKELKFAEDNNQTAYIIGHIPPGTINCLREYSKRYNVLIERFSHIVRGQFFGHHHSDHFRVQYAHNTSDIVGIINCQISTTFFGTKYPGFGVYEVDRDTNLVVNYAGYRLVLENSTRDKLEIIKAYDFLSLYNYTKLEPKTYEDLANRIAKDEKLAKTYSNLMNGDDVKDPRNKIKYKAEPSWNQQLSCYLKSTNMDQRIQCEGIPWYKDTDYILVNLEEMFLGGWYRSKKAESQVLEGVVA